MLAKTQVKHYTAVKQIQENLLLMSQLQMLDRLYRLNGMSRLHVGESVLWFYNHLFTHAVVKI